MENELVNQLEEFFAEEDSHIPVYGGPKPGIAATAEEATVKIPTTTPPPYVSGGNSDPLLTPERECQIVRDMLPMYADDACSLYTKDFVKRHLEHCSECRHTLANMEMDVTVSIITDAEADLHRLKKSMFKKQYSTIALLTAFFTALLCLFSFSFIADAVRAEVAEEYRSKYYFAVEEYKRELEEGDPIDQMEEKIWEMVEASRANEENKVEGYIDE